jgi:hypothetical protein
MFVPRPALAALSAKMRPAFLLQEDDLLPILQRRTFGVPS